MEVTQGHYVGEDVSMDAVVGQAFDEEVDGRDESTVGDIGGTVSASKNTTHPASPIDDSGPRVSAEREGTGLRVVRQHADLLRHLTGPAFEEYTRERANGVQAADSEARCIPILQYHDDWVVLVVFVPRVRPVHLLVGDGAEEPKETVSWVLERALVSRVGAHPGSKFTDLNGAKVNGITNEVDFSNH